VTFSKSAALVIVLAACVNPTEPATPVALTMAGSLFDRGAPIPLTIVNSSNQSAFVGACGPTVSIEIEQRRRVWEPYAGGICLAIYVFEPRELAPGATISRTIWIEDAGTYRLTIQAGADARRLLTVTSASFLVR